MPFGALLGFAVLVLPRFAGGQAAGGEVDAEVVSPTTGSAPSDAISGPDIVAEVEAEEAEPVNAAEMDTDN